MIYTKIKVYLCSICKEQDDNSLHCYNVDKLDISDTDIVIAA